MLNMLDKVKSFLFLRSLRIKNLRKKFLENIGSEFSEEFLELLLRLMSLYLQLDKDFRRNIRDFHGKYQFMTKDGQIALVVIFKDGKLKVYEKKIDNANVTIIFRTSNALRDFLFTTYSDILGSLLRNDISFSGNLNYLYKFSYMAKRLQQILMSKSYW